MKQKVILVPTDFSETANHASVQAAELSMRYNAALHFVHVRDKDSSSTALRSLLDFFDRLEASNYPSLTTKLDILRGVDIEIGFDELENDSVLEGILEAVERLTPGIVVMGTHGRTRFERLFMGSVAEKVLRHVEGDVLTLRETSPIVRAVRAFERILVPVDFSEPSKRAVATAASLLVPGGELTLVHVVSSPVHPSFYAAGVTRLLDVDPDLAGRIDARLVEWLGGEDRHKRLVREGNISQELTQAASEVEAQLIVMGTRGLTGLDHLLLGSVAERMVRLSKLPVLSVH